MVIDDQIRLYPVQLAEEEINNIAERLIKLLLDNDYNPIEIIEIFSEEFDKSQVREIIAFYIGMEKLESLEESKNEPKS